MTPKNEILGQKYAHFDRFEGSFLTNLGSKTHFQDIFDIFKDFRVN